MTALDTLRGGYSREDAAAYLGCGTDKLREYVMKGLIAPHYHGVKPVYLRRDLDDLLDTLPTQKPGDEQ